MESLTITLKIDGKDKKFVTPDFISGKFFRTAAAIAEDFESNDDDRLFTEKQNEFVCNIFGNKFTLDEFENGIDSRLAARTIYATANYVLGNIKEASALLNPNQNADGEEPGGVSLSEAVMDMYNALEEVGFSQNQIDEMDIVYHLKRLARRKETTENPKPNENDQMYIDQILG